MNRVYRKKRTTNENVNRTKTWQIVIGNINSFPNEYNGSNKYKLDTLKSLVTKHHSDIILISEHNRNFTNSGTKPQSLDIKHWWKNTVIRTSSLASANTCAYEPGGTMIITNTRSTAHTCEAGVDRENLGRWNYITLKGKRNYYMTVISVYRPTKYQETYLRQTAYTAKRRKILGIDKTPENLWFYDLKDLIEKKMIDGHEVIVAGDFNDDLNNPKAITRVFMSSLHYGREAS
jgi:Endonuclease/Exonuclease/phosphatase family.